MRPYTVKTDIWCKAPACRPWLSGRWNMVWNASVQSRPSRSANWAAEKHSHCKKLFSFSEEEVSLKKEWHFQSTNIWGMNLRKWHLTSVQQVRNLLNKKTLSTGRQHHILTTQYADLADFGGSAYSIVLTDIIAIFRAKTPGLYRAIHNELWFVLKGRKHHVFFGVFFWIFNRTFLTLSNISSRWN